VFCIRICRSVACCLLPVACCLLSVVYYTHQHAISILLLEITGGTWLRLAWKGTLQNHTACLYWQFKFLLHPEYIPGHVEVKGDAEEAAAAQ
jgi:hypothetical protein